MRRFLPTVLVLTGLSLAGWVAMDDTGDDLGTIGVASNVAEGTASADARAQAASDITASSDDLDAADTSAATGREASPAPTPRPARGTTADGSSVPVRSMTMADLTAAPPVPPARIELPSIGVEAEIVIVGTDEDGAMEVPEDVATVGWYRATREPAAGRGTVVLAGHVDSRTQGRGAFFDLRAMELGDQITVTDADGVVSTWRVTGRGTFAKDGLPGNEIFRREGDQRLVLITCGGEFDRAVGSYKSNIIVEAEPID